MKKTVYLSLMALGFVLLLFNTKYPPLKPESPKSAAVKPAALSLSAPPFSSAAAPTAQPKKDINNIDSLPAFKDLEQASADLADFQKKVGDDPRKMTNKELEISVQLFEAYNKQLELVLNQYERGVL